MYSKKPRRYNVFDVLFLSNFHCSYANFQRDVRMHFGAVGNQFGIASIIQAFKKIVLTNAEHVATKMRQQWYHLALTIPISGAN